MRIDELERLAAAERAGQGQGYNTSHDHSDNVTFHRPPTPQERVYNAILLSGGGVTRGDIARALGLRKTPWLIAHIDAMVADGYLRRTHGLSVNEACQELRLDPPKTTPVKGYRRPQPEPPVNTNDAGDRTCFLPDWQQRADHFVTQSFLCLHDEPAGEAARLGVDLVAWLKGALA